MVAIVEADADDLLGVSDGGEQVTRDEGSLGDGGLLGGGGEVAPAFPGERPLRVDGMAS